MLMSMTGFGRSSQERSSLGPLLVEIQSVNKRYLEISVYLPKEFQRFENEVRHRIGASVGRGQVTVRVHLLLDPGNVNSLLPDAQVLIGLKKGWEDLASRLEIDPKKIDLSFLVQSIPDRQSLCFAADSDLQPLYQAIDSALIGLQDMKRKEGAALAKDIFERVDTLQSLSEKVGEHVPNAAAKMRQKLAERMKDLFSPSEALDERLFREIALFAEKIDVSEELVRLKSHFLQFRNLRANKEGGAGRKMDFYVQEMGREINTIGSKSADPAIAHLVVEMKSELEKMREQIQNVE